MRSASLESMRFTHVGYAQQLRFGAGSCIEAAGFLRQLRVQRAMLVTTAQRRASQSGQRVAESLGPMLVAVFDGVRSHVPESCVRAALQLAQRERADAIVSFGGGSCADLGKAVCYFSEQERGALGASCFDRPALPHVAIPTAYSGAEVTAHFGMTDEAARRKSGAGAPTTAPAAVLYDPEVTLDLPPRVSAETGMNALAHCVEAAWSPARTVEAEAIALAGAARIYRWLPQVVERPADLAARSEMLAGAMLGGRALQNASMGVHHGLSQLVGGRTGIPHGLANAVILAHAIRFNADAVGSVIEGLAAAFGRTDGDAAGAVDDLRARIGLPARLSECGVTREDLEAVVGLSTGNANIGKNPKKVSESDARAILEGAY
jgi:maleylacetate reductase